MAETKIKAAQFHGVVGHGTDGYFLMTNADGSMSWAEGGASGPSVTSVAYPGDDLAADPAGAQTVVLTGTGFASSGMSVSIGGTTAPSVAHDSNTQLTITTPAKAAGDYDIVVTNTVTGASGTFVNGISYNGVPTWTTAAGSLGTFESETTISTITLAATEPDGGTITFNITNGALPTGLSLTGANIDGTTTAESSTTLYSFTIEAIDNENQATPRNFSITVNSAEIVPSQNFTINTYTGNGSTQSIEGKIGTAASFDGSSSYVSLPSNFNLANNSFTISAWFANTKTSANSYGITSSGSGSSCHTNLHIGRRGNNSKFTFAFFCSDLDSSTNMSTDGTWQHWVCTYDASNNSRKIYLNGTLDASDTASNDYIGTANLQLGGDTYWGTGNEYQGKLDQVRIFNKAVSSSEVTTLYNEPSNLSTASTTDIFDDGSGVALYEFEEGAKDTGVPIDDGQSASFIGTNQNYIQLPSGIDTILNTKNFGLSLWVKAPNAATDAVFSTETTNSTFQIHANWGFAGAYGLINGGGSDINLGAVDSNWHHIVVTSDGSSSYKGYFDKSYKGASAYRQTSNVGTFLGAHPSGGFNLNGQIDQVRIFNRQLSQSDIDSLYDETSPSTVDYFGDGNGKALYRLDGNPNDTSGSYNATWNNTAAYIEEAATVKFDGTPTNVSFVGTSFQPDLVWVKSRSGAFNNMLTDSINGDNTFLIANTTATLDTNSSAPQFNTNGFTLGAGNNNWNGSSYTYVAWCWKAGGAAVSGTGTGGVTSVNQSANTDAGFSIVEFSTPASGNGTATHGLNETPEFIIYKRTSNTGQWTIYHSATGVDKFLFFTSIEAATDTGVWSTPSLTTVPVNVGKNVSANSDYIAYCFHSVDGYQKVGSYTGNSVSGRLIDVGFRARWVMIKTTNKTSNWFILDSERGGTNDLRANASNAEESRANGVTFVDDGFELDDTSVGFNDSTTSYIYLAIA